MAYTKIIWVAEETALSADNFNHMEDGIDEASKASEIDSTVTTYYANTLGWQAPASS